MFLPSSSVSGPSVSDPRVTAPRLVRLASICTLAACLFNPLAAHAQAADALAVEASVAGVPVVGILAAPAAAADEGAGVTFASIADDAASAPPPEVNAAKLSCNSKMARLLDDPVARTVLRGRIPDVVDSPQISMARGLTLRQLAHFRRAGITPETLAEIETDLAALP